MWVYLGVLCDIFTVATEGNLARILHEVPFVFHADFGGQLVNVL